MTELVIEVKKKKVEFPFVSVTAMQVTGNKNIYKIWEVNAILVLGSSDKGRKRS